MRFLRSTFIALAFVWTAGSAVQAGVFTDFNSFTNGNVNGQGGWIATGPYDQGVVDLGGGNKVLRISNATTSGSFGDMPFSAPTPTPSGESTAVGAVTNKFFASFDIWSKTGAAQPGLFMSISPDSGDGSRMSYVSIADNGFTGLDATFIDFLGGVFVSHPLGTLSYSGVHNIAFDITFNNGNATPNDVVTVYVDGVLKATGTTWEQYYPLVQPSHPSPFAIDSLLFRVAGTAATGTLGNGYYIDNVLVTDVAVPEPSTMIVWSVLGLAFGVVARRRKSAV